MLKQKEVQYIANVNEVTKDLVGLMHQGDF